MSVRINIELGHEASIRTKRTQEGFTHDWEVSVRGCDGADISNYVEKVVFYLHETFPKPKRVIKEPPYSVKESGYAGFNLPIDIYLRNKDEPKKIKFNYDLNLQPSGPAIFKVQKEKQVFHNPSEEFKHRLMKGGGIIVSSSSGQDLAEIKSNPEEKPQLLNKPKLGGSEMIKKHKAKDDFRTTNSFNDLFGTPIKKMSKISPDPKVLPKEPPTKSSTTKEKDKDRSANSFNVLFGEPIKKMTKNFDPNNPAKDLNKIFNNKEGEKGSEKERNKNKSPAKDRDRPKDKSDPDRKVKDKEKNKEKNRGERDRSKEKKREKSPRLHSLSPKRPPSPKRSPPPPQRHKETQEKRTDSSNNKEKEKKSDDAKKYKKEKQRDYSENKYKESLNKDYNKVKEKIMKDVVVVKEASPMPPLKTEKKEKPKELIKEEPPVEKVVREKSEEKKEKHKHKKKDKDKRDKKDDKAHKLEKKNDKMTKEPAKESLFASPKQELELKKKPLSTLFNEIENENSNSSVSSKDDVYVEPSPLAPPPPPPPIEKPESIYEPAKKDVKAKKDKTKRKEKKAEKEEKKRKRKSELKPEEEPESKLVKEEPYSDAEQHAASQSKEVDKENQENPEEYMKILRELQQKIMTLQDNAELQKVVQLIAETGRYELTNRTFDFDLCLLERSTVRRLQEFFAPTS